MNIKIYEGKLINCIKNCLKDGKFPATLEQIKELKVKGLIDKDKLYDTSTISYKGEKRTATLEELNNIEALYKKGGRLWFVNNWNDSIAYGDYILTFGVGRLVGVSAEPKHKGKCCECVGDKK